MVYLFGLCSVLDVCIEFVYFNVNEGLCLLFNWIIYFLDRIINDEKQFEFGIIWFWDGNLNIQFGFLYEFNYFDLFVLNYDEGNSYEFEKVEDKMLQQLLLLLLFIEGIWRKKLFLVSIVDKSEIVSIGMLEFDLNEFQFSVGYYKKFKFILLLLRKNDLNCVFDILNYIVEGFDFDDVIKMNII